MIDKYCKIVSSPNAVWIWFPRPLFLPDWKERGRKYWLFETFIAWYATMLAWRSRTEEHIRLWKV
ncbi:MAG: hypothetical protein ACKER6_00040 [Candidatus Hodgkinia cicadicola]